MSTVDDFGMRCFTSWRGPQRDSLTYLADRIDLSLQRREREGRGNHGPPNCRGRQSSTRIFIILHVGTGIWEA